MTINEYNKILPQLNFLTEEEKSIIIKLNTIPVGKSSDITGKKFNRLLVLGRAEIRGRKNLWWCICDCHNILKVRADFLKSNHTTSCGCYNKEIVIRNNKKRSLDLTNQIFGYLKPIEPTDERSSDNSIIWKCLCLNDNRYCKVSLNKLRTGHTISCGCIKESRGEFKIKKLLSNNNISFQTEKTFNSCKFIDTNSAAKFDFYVNNTYLIEFDGEPHFKATGGWNTEEHLKKVKIRDEYKNQWCKDNGIPLIRIPYTHLKDLCIEDLLLETSKFII